MDSEDDDYDSDEEEEGQYQIPEDVVRDIPHLVADQFYLVCYLRLKTEEELEIEH